MLLSFSFSLFFLLRGFSVICTCRVSNLKQDGSHVRKEPFSG